MSPDRPVALIENDGVHVVGTGVLDAFDRLEVLESTAEAIVNSRAVGEVHRMDDERIEGVGAGVRGEARREVNRKENLNSLDDLALT